MVRLRIQEPEIKRHRRYLRFLMLFAVTMAVMAPRADAHSDQAAILRALSGLWVRTDYTCTQPSVNPNGGIGEIYLLTIPEPKEMTVTGRDFEITARSHDDAQIGRDCRTVVRGRIVFRGENVHFERLDQMAEVIDCEGGRIPLLLLGSAPPEPFIFPGGLPGHEILSKPFEGFDLRDNEVASCRQSWGRPPALL